VSCQAGQTNCSGACTSLQSDPGNCGACGTACGANTACSAGNCAALSPLSGNGTAAIPYTSTPPLTNCTQYKTAFGALATSGVYTAEPVASAIQVYCDMTGAGVTYQEFAFGQYNVAFAGFTLLDPSDFTSNLQLQNALVHLYDRSGGLVNLNPGWNSQNCCFINSTGNGYYGFNGNHYMYPAQNGAMDCNAVYSASVIQVDLISSGGILSTVTQAELASTATSTQCSVSNNPGIFVERC
jgi:hypothetical protein